MTLLEKTKSRIHPQDQKIRAAVKNRLDNLAIPHWSLGDLMDLALDLSGMQATTHPVTRRKAMVAMAGDHGIVAEGVSKFPSEVTPQMVQNFVNGGAGINALSREVGAKVFVVDMGVNADLSHLVKEGKVIDKKVAMGTKNFAREPAMTRAEAERSLEAGIEVANSLAGKYDIVGTGDMGIGNTTPSSAIAAVLTGKGLQELTGRGTGLNDEQLQHKIDVLQRALTLHSPSPDDALDLLAKVGGFEIGGIAGLILGAAAMRMPVVVDGFISTAGAMIACCYEPMVKEYLIFSHKSVEPGHRAMQEYLGCRKPLLDLNFRLGEGTGSAVAMHLLDAAVAVLTEIATFEEAAVAQADK